MRGIFMNEKKEGRKRVLADLKQHDNRPLSWYKQAHLKAF
jgi:hypothetical protein